MSTLTKEATIESGLLKRLFSANLRTTLFSELAFAAGTVIDGIITSRFVGELFDPEKWMDEHLSSPEDISGALGLRILLFLSMDYEYRQTFKLNNVYLTIDQDVFRTEEGTNVR